VGNASQETFMISLRASVCDPVMHGSEGVLVFDRQSGDFGAELGDAVGEIVFCPVRVLMVVGDDDVLMIFSIPARYVLADSL
jgi:hypothetical protein